MANNDIRQNVDITANGAQFNGVAQQVIARLLEMEKAGKNAGNSISSTSTRFRQNLQSIRDQLQRVQALALTFFGAQGGAAGVQQLVAIADQYRRIEQRLKSIVGDARELSDVQQRLRSTARATGEAYTGVFDVFRDLQPVLRDLGASNAQVAQLTDTILKAVQVDGGGLADAQAVGNQIAESLVSGVVDSRALKQLRKASPELFQALIEGSGKSAQELSRLAKSGQLDVQTLVRAIESSRPKIEQSFEALPRTIERAAGRITQAFSQYTADADKANGVSDRIVASLESVADNFAAVANVMLTTLKAGLALYITQLAQRAIPATLALAGALRGLLSIFGAAAIAKIVADFLFQFAPVRQFSVSLITAYKKAGAEIAFALKSVGPVVTLAFISLFDGIRNRGADLADSLANLLSKVPTLVSQGSAVALRAGAKAIRTEQNKAADLALQDLARFARERDAALADIDRDGFSAFQLAGADESVASPSASGDAGATTLNGDAFGGARALDALKRAGEAANVVFEQALKTARADVESALDQNLISYRAYYDQLAELERIAIDRQTEQLRGESALTDSAEERAVLVAKITALEAEREQVGVRSAREIAKAERALDAERQQLGARLASATGNESEGALARLQIEIEGLRKRFTGDAGAQGLLTQILNAESARISLAKFEADFNRVRDGLQRREQQIERDRASGALSEIQAQERLNAARAEARPLLEGSVVAAEALGTNFQFAADGAARLRGELEVTTTKLDVVGLRLSENLTNGIESAFAKLLEGTANVKDAFLDLALSFAQAIQAELIKVLVKNLLGSFIDSFSGAISSGITGAAVAHQGGVIGSLPLSRSVPAFAFAGAPRLHGGGLAGLKPNEVPTILERGEEVLTRNDPRHRFNGGGRGVTVNISTPDAASFLKSRDQVNAELGTAIRRALARNG